MDKLSAYMAHTFIKEEQHEFFNTIKKSDKDNCILMQIDFAQNFTIAYQDEIQSAHWAKKQIAIFTRTSHIHMQSFPITCHMIKFIIL